MSCNPEMLKSVPLFSLLDDEETTVLAAQVDVKEFAARERIYKAGDPGIHAYVVVSGKVQVTTVDEDQQEVIVDEPEKGGFFGFASMLEETPRQTTAFALEDCVCIEVSRSDITVLLERKPHAGMDLLTTLGHQLHATQQLVRLRATRNANEIIEQQETRESTSPMPWQVSAGPGRSSSRLQPFWSFTRSSTCVWAERHGTPIPLSCSTFFSPCSRRSRLP